MEGRSPGAGLTGSQMLPQTFIPSRCFLLQLAWCLLQGFTLQLQISPRGKQQLISMWPFAAKVSTMHMLCITRSLGLPPTSVPVVPVEKQKGEGAVKEKMEAVHCGRHYMGSIWCKWDTTLLLFLDSKHSTDGGKSDWGRTSISRMIRIFAVQRVFQQFPAALRINPNSFMWCLSWVTLH